MLKIVAVSIFLFCNFFAYAQEDYSSILDKAHVLHKEEKNIEGAIELLDSVWNSCKSENATSEGCFEVLIYLAFYHRINRDYDSALDHYLLMIDYDTEGIHHCLAYNYISNLLNKKRNHSLALDMALKGYYHEKINCKWKHNLSHSIAKSISFLGDSTLYEQGIAWIDTSLTYYNHCGSGNQRNIVSRLMDKGNLWLKMDNHTKAINAYTECNELLEDNDKNASEKYRILNNLGASHARLGNYDLAIDYYKKSTAIYSKRKWNYSLQNLSILYRNMARVSRERKDYNGALEWIQKSDDYLEDCLQSDSTLLEAIYSDKIWNRKEELFNHTKIYQQSKDKTDMEKAYLAGKTAITQYLVLRNMVFGDQNRMIGLQEFKTTLDEFVRVCLILGKTDEAFYICEKTKYLNLIEHLDNFDPSSITQVANRLQLIPTDVNDLRNIVGANKERVVYLEQEIDLFRQSLELNDSPVIYSYYLLEENYIVFIHENNTTKVEYLEKAAKIDSMIALFLKEIKNREAIDSSAHDLFSLLFPQQEVKDSNILLVPHGHLTKLPFASLKRNNRYLISDIQFYYKKSILLPNSIYKSRDLLGIQPLYTGDKMDGKLPFAKREAQYLKNQFGFNVLQKDRASIENLSNLNSELDIMHLIGHYTMDTENYRNSYFSLSEDQKMDSFRYIEHEFEIQSSYTFCMFYIGRRV